MQAADPIPEVVRWLRDARSVVVLTGAGMSAESGIPTFRDARNGLWSRFDPEKLATPNAYRQDKALVWGWYVWRMAMVRQARPHAGHLALAELAALGPEVSIITQNVDDLHERAGSRNVIHLHGDLFAPRCFACGRPCDDIELPADALDKPALRLMPPKCARCGGHVRPGVVWFGETLPATAWKRAEQLVRQCDLLLAVGTSGIVYPAADLPDAARARGARVVEINPVATQMSDKANRVWRTPAGEALPELVDRLAS